MKTIKECLDVAVATPLNTIGMGNIDPCNTDPIPCKKQKKYKKRKMKSLTDYIKKTKQQSIEESMDRGDWESRVWSTDEVTDFFSILGINDKDIELFNDSHKEEITEYAAVTNISEDFILSKISTMKELEDFEPTLLYKMLQITKGESNAYWYDNGSGLDTICLEVMDNNRDKTYLFVFGADKYKFDKILSEITDVTSENFKPHECLKDIFVFDTEE